MKRGRSPSIPSSTWVTTTLLLQIFLAVLPAFLFWLVGVAVVVVVGVNALVVQHENSNTTKTNQDGTNNIRRRIITAVKNSCKGYGIMVVTKQREI